MKEERERHKEYVARDKCEETTKGKAAPAGEAQRRRRKPGKPCEEQLEIKHPASRKADWWLFSVGKTWPPSAAGGREEATKKTADTAKCLPNKWQIRPTRRKAGLSSERKVRKPLWKGWLYVLIWPTWKICQRRSEFSPWVKSCIEWENEKGKGVNSRTNKKANDERHICTQVPRLHGTTGLNKGFENAGLKGTKSMGDPYKAWVSQLVNK